MKKYILYYETDSCIIVKHFGDFYDCILYLLYEFHPETEELYKIKIVYVD